MGELGHPIGLLWRTQSIIATWLIFSNWCWWLRLTWDSLCLCISTSPWQPLIKGITNPKSLTLTHVEPCNLILVVLTNILSLLYQALDAPPYDRDTQFKALYMASCWDHHSIVSPLNNRIRDSVDEDIMKIPSDAKGGFLPHSAVRRQKPREIWSTRELGLRKIAEIAIAKGPR